MLTEDAKKLKDPRLSKKERMRIEERYGITKKPKPEKAEGDPPK
jgi:hypothetical protein